MNASPINTVIHGDCTQILPQLALGRVDFVLTDLPYVNRYAARDGRTIQSDNFAWLKPAFALATFASLVVCTASEGVLAGFVGSPAGNKVSECVLRPGVGFQGAALLRGLDSIHHEPAYHRADFSIRSSICVGVPFPTLSIPSVFFRRNRRPKGSI